MDFSRIAEKMREAAEKKAQQDALAQRVSQSGAGQMVVGPDGLMRVAGGLNRYGEERPDTVLMRDESGNLDERFTQTMTPEYLALQQKAMTEGDTRSAQLARERQGIMQQGAMDSLQKQASSALTGGMQNLAMRGGAGMGSRERLNRDISRQLMGGNQGISRDGRLANLAISQQDESMKNQLLGQVGQVGQMIQEGNINRLQQDIRDQNLSGQNIYGEDMQAFAADKSADAQAKAACFTGETSFLMEDGSEKPIIFIKLGEKLLDGGKVFFKSESLTTDLYMYNGDRVTGSHAVKEAGKWIRVEDSELSEKILGEYTVYCVGNENHIMRTIDNTFSDFFETDEYEELSIDESLAALNEKLD